MNNFLADSTVVTGKVATGLVNSGLLTNTEQVGKGVVDLEQDTATVITAMVITAMVITAITEPADSVAEGTGQADSVVLVRMDQLDTVDTDLMDTD